MSARVRKGIIEVRSPRGIERYRSQSVCRPVALSSQEFERTCPENKSTKVWITLRPVVGLHRDRMHWNQLGERNLIILVSKRLDGYTCQQGEKGTYRSRQMSARVGKGHIGIR